MTDSVVVIPTYNEKENIVSIIEAVLDLPKKIDVLIVDDQSPDGTSELVEHMIQKRPERVFILKRKKKLGLGTAYIDGFRWVLAQGRYDYIFEMDADFSHNPVDLIRLYEACAKDENDFVIGSRYVTGVNVVNWPMKRVLLSYFASKYVRFITGLPIHDTTAGFMCYHRNVLEEIELEKINCVGYAFQIEMKFRAWRKGFRFQEVSIIFTERSKGKSKLNKGIFKEAVFGVLKLRLKTILNTI